jgi:glutamate carboxypeptidase
MLDLLYNLSTNACHLTERFRMNDVAPILDWIDQQSESMIDTLTRWSNINSATYNQVGLAAFAEQLAPLLRQLSPHIEFIPLPPHTVISNTGQKETRPLGQAIRLRKADIPGAPRALLNIHYDTVYVPTDPFQTATRIDATTLRGPGVTDAKGGLLVMLTALLALERSQLASNLQWEVLINPDEEIGSPGSTPLFLEAAKRNDIGLLFEPANSAGAMASSRKGSGTFTLIAHGKSAHSGRDPQVGRNAIHALAALITKVIPIQSEVPGITVNTGSFHAAGPSNIVPDFALCRINCRVENEAQKNAIERRLDELVADVPEGITIEKHGQFGFPPKPVTPAMETLYQQIEGCAKELNIALSWRPVGGASDGNRLAAAGLPNIDALGPRGGNIHTDQEFCHLESLTERTKLTALYLLKLAGGDIRVPPR